MQRRFFLMGSAAATTAIRSSALPSANERVRVACVGVRGQGQSHIRAYSKMPNVEIAAICDVDESVLEQRLQGCGEADAEASGRLHGFAQASRRQIHRRHFDRNTEPLARAASDLGLPGRERRLRRKTVRVQHIRGAAAWRSGEEVQTHGAARHKRAILRNNAGSSETGSRRRDRRRLHVARSLSSSGATPSAGSQSNPSPPAFTMTFGWDPLRKATSRGIASITTSIGSGITAMAISATRASTKSMPRGGCSA